MSYEQQNWVTGHRITAEKLNHMEDGIASANSGGGTEPLIVHDNGGTLDKTWQEIHDAFVSGQNVLIFGTDKILCAYTVGSSEFPPESGTIVYEADGYTTDSANGYPSLRDDYL